MPSTVVNCTCRACGQIQLTSRDIALFVYENDALHSHYAFTCPSCGQVMRWHADDTIIARLVGIGIRAQRSRMPLELLEPHPDGAQFTSDDILDLILEIDQWSDEASS